MKSDKRHLTDEMELLNRDILERGNEKKIKRISQEN